jgi:hypothetical protein
MSSRDDTCGNDVPQSAALRCRCRLATLPVPWRRSAALRSRRSAAQRLRRTPVERIQSAYLRAPFALPGSTRTVMTARTTSAPFLSTALTGTAMFCASPHSALSSRAVAVTSDSAWRRYSIVMPREYQCIVAGKVTSVTVLAANSHRVAIASGCIVLCPPPVPRCLAMTTIQSAGRSSRK